MDEVTGTREREAEPELSEPERRDPRFVAAREAGGGEAGREMLEHAAQGATLDRAEERSALDWLLGPPKPIVHAVPVDYETPAGMAKVTFVLKAIDTRRIDEIEQRNVNETTGMIDRLTADCELVTAATMHLEDASGKVVPLDSDEFLTVAIRDPRTGESEPRKLASPAMALERHFRDQLGLISGVALQVKRSAGYHPDRVGSAQRRLVEAALG